MEHSNVFNFLASQIDGSLPFLELITLFDFIFALIFNFLI